jgi:methionyl aminopeptidase
VHGIPDKYVLKNGDVLKIDMGVTYQKCIADAAISLVIGGDHTNPVGADLIHTTKLALDQ